MGRAGHTKKEKRKKQVTGIVYKKQGRSKNHQEGYIAGVERKLWTRAVRDKEHFKVLEEDFTARAALTAQIINANLN